MIRRNDPTVLTRHAYILVRLLVRRGHAESTARLALGFPAYDEIQPQDRMSFHDFVVLCHKACEVADDPLFCFKAGYDMDISDLGLLGQLFTYSADIREAMKYIIRFQALLTEGLVWSVMSGKSGTDIFLSPALSEKNSEFYAPLIELRTGMGIRFATTATACSEGELFKTIHFQHKPRADLSRYQALSELAIRFEKPFNKIIAIVDFLDVPIDSHNSEALEAVIASAAGEERNE